MVIVQEQRAPSRRRRPRGRARRGIAGADNDLCKCAVVGRLIGVDALVADGEEEGEAGRAWRPVIAKPRRSASVISSS